MVIVSPFTRGGLICSDTFDHTSMLRFVERRFRVEMPGYDSAKRRPGLTRWRRSAVGDLTSEFNFAAAPDASTPLPPSILVPNRADPRVITECLLTAEPLNLASNTFGSPYPPPASPSQPTQEPLAHPVRRPRGPVARCGTAGAAEGSAPGEATLDAAVGEHPVPVPPLPGAGSATLTVGATLGRGRLVGPAAAFERGGGRRRLAQLSAGGWAGESWGPAGCGGGRRYTRLSTTGRWLSG